MFKLRRLTTGRFDVYLFTLHPFTLKTLHKQLQVFILLNTKHTVYVMISYWRVHTDNHNLFLVNKILVIT